MTWIGAVGELFQFFNRVLFLRPRRQIEKVVNIYDAMNKAISESSIERFTVFKVHNGGGIINPTGDMYVSILYEEYGVPFFSIKNDIQKLILDKQAVRLLLETMQRKQVKQGVKSLPEGIIKDIYIKSGAKRFILVYIEQDRRNVYFASCSSSSEDSSWMTSASDNVAIQVAITTIKKNIK